MTQLCTPFVWPLAKVTSVLSTISLTIPTMIAISYLSGHPLILGVEHTDEWPLIVEVQR